MKFSLSRVFDIIIPVSFSLINFRALYIKGTFIRVCTSKLISARTEKIFWKKYGLGQHRSFCNNFLVKDYPLSNCGQASCKQRSYFNQTNTFPVYRLIVWPYCPLPSVESSVVSSSATAIKTQADPVEVSIQVRLLWHRLERHAEGKGKSVVSFEMHIEIAIFVMVMSIIVIVITIIFEELSSKRR